MKSTRHKRVYLVIAGIIILGALIFFGCFFGKKIYTNSKMNEAAEYVKAEKYQEAIDLYELLLDKNSENIEAEKEVKNTYVLFCQMYLDDNLFNEALNTAKVGHESTKYSKLLNMIEMIESGEIENDEEQLIKKINFASDGRVSDFTVYVYYKNGDLKREEHYNSSREMKTYEIYEYDQAHRLTGKRYYYTEKDELYFQEIYDFNGDLIEIQNYNEDGEITYRETYKKEYTDQVTTKFFENGIITEEVRNQFGDLKEQTDWDVDGEYVVSEFDNNQLLIKTSYRDKKGDLICYQEYNNDFSDGLLRYAYNEEGYLQYIYEYNQEGNVFCKYEYDEYESLIEATEYDDKGREVVILWFDYWEEIEQYLLIEYREKMEIYRYYELDYYYNESLAYYDVYEYDENYNELKMTSFYGDGSLAYYYNNEYDKDGNIMTRHDYDGMGESDGWVDFDCDENGYPIRAEYYGPNKEFYGSIERTFDDKGNLQRIETFDNQNRSYAFAEYVYDDDGYEIWNYFED